MLERVAARRRADAARDAARPFSRPAPRDLLRLAAHSAGASAGSGRRRPARRWRCSPAPARTILDRWFESDELKATLATDAIIGAMASPVHARHRLRALPPRHGRDATARRGVWGYVRAAWAGSPQALAARGARRAGVEIRTRGAGGADPGRGTGAPTGVVLAGGEEVRRAAWSRNADATSRCSAWSGREELPAGVRRGGPGASTTRAPRSRSTWPSPSCPSFTRAARARRRPAAPRHHPHLPRPRLHRAGLRRRQVRAPVRAARARVHHPLGGGSRPWRRPAATSCRSSCSTRPTGSPRASWDDRRRPSPTGASTLLDEYAPNFRRSVLHRQVLTPARHRARASASPAATSSRAR